MNQRTVSATIIAISAILLLGGKVLNIILSFALTGVIPGTHIVIPYWAMISLYCLAITAIVTPYLEHLIYLVYRSKKTVAKKQLPRRRYSSLPS